MPWHRNNLLEECFNRSSPGLAKLFNSICPESTRDARRMKGLTLSYRMPCMPAQCDDENMRFYTACLTQLCDMNPMRKRNTITRLKEDSSLMYEVYGMLEEGFRIWPGMIFTMHSRGCVFNDLVCEKNHGISLSIDKFEKDDMRMFPFFRKREQVEKYLKGRAHSLNARLRPYLDAEGQMTQLYLMHHGAEKIQGFMLRAVEEDADILIPDDTFNTGVTQRFLTSLARHHGIRKEKIHPLCLISERHGGGEFQKSPLV